MTKKKKDERKFIFSPLHWATLFFCTLIYLLGVYYLVRHIFLTSLIIWLLLLLLVNRIFFFTNMWLWQEPPCYCLTIKLNVNKSFFFFFKSFSVTEELTNLYCTIFFFSWFELVGFYGDKRVKDNIWIYVTFSIIYFL